MKGKREVRSEFTDFTTRPRCQSQASQRGESRRISISISFTALTTACGASY